MYINHIADKVVAFWTIDEKGNVLLGWWVKRKNISNNLYEIVNGKDNVKVISFQKLIKI